MAAEAGLDCRNLVKRFGDTRVIDDVSLAIRAGEFFTLLGPSGCGKTTLLRLIAGLEQPDSGSIALGGRSLHGLPAWRRPVNTVFQNYAVFPHLTVARNVAFGLQMARRPGAEIAARVAEMLRLVRLEGMERRRPAQLSGGQQQRVALARALANAPEVLLLDEPLSALDLKLRTGMQMELKRLQAGLGITFVCVTHDQQEALTMSDRIAVMQAGRILQVGTPAEIYESPAARFVADFIGETNLLDARPLGGSRFALAAGGELQAAGDGAWPAAVTLAVRPERASLGAPGEGLDGVVAQVVYQGTDTTYHVRLAGGLRFAVRAQNREGAAPAARPGDAVSVRVPPEAVRVLTD